MPMTPTVAISRDVLTAFMAIPRSHQRKVSDFITKFQRDPMSPGINYEKIRDARNPYLRSVRIDQAYRGLLLKPDEGNVFVLLWVDRHDAAYQWARTHACEVHPETGALQIYETQTIDAPEQAPVPVPATAPPASPGATPAAPLFRRTPEELLSIGVPRDQLAAVEKVCTEEQFIALQTHLPEEASEALTTLLAGEDSWEEILRAYGPDTRDKIDPQDIGAALQRPGSQRSFHVVEDEFELLEMLEAPLEKWRVFLHPSQRKLVERTWNGPVRVLGGAGTGKTVVAMHRARWLARTLASGVDTRILFTTFTANLATDIAANLQKICRPEELTRIEVKNIDLWVREFLRQHNYPHAIIYAGNNPRFDEVWKQALEQKPADPELPNSFYREEWDRVILPQRVLTRADYFKANRTGRGVALTRRQRGDVWPVFEAVRNQLQQQGMRPFEDATLDVLDLLQQHSDAPPYTSVIVDEAQDMGPQALTLLRHLVPEQANDLFLVGDGHQRIYQRQAVMSQCGINIRGRSQKLRINYRTTEETRRFATALLGDAAVDDLDGGRDTLDGYRSLLHGRAPEVRGFASAQEEQAWIVEQIRNLLDDNDNVTSQDICVVARLKKQRDELRESLERAGLPGSVIEGHQSDDRSQAGIRLATMHRVKGLEFHYLFIAGVNHGVVPLPWVLSGTQDPVETRQIMLGERALLHVSATRAIRRLFVSYSGTPSVFLREIQEPGATSPA